MHSRVVAIRNISDESQLLSRTKYNSAVNDSGHESSSSQSSDGSSDECSLLQPFLDQLTSYPAPCGPKAKNVTVQHALNQRPLHPMESVHRRHTPSSRQMRQPLSKRAIYAAGFTWVPRIIGIENGHLPKNFSVASGNGIGGSNLRTQDITGGTAMWVT